MSYEECIPNPEFLIKSIAEQGYTLETSIADLLDNSISAGAKKIEILVETEKRPLRLFIADDGCGMTLSELKQNMQFPSSSPESKRNVDDLGRFGLGLKTASFAQTRCFTVLTKKEPSKKFVAITWDVDHLKASKRWQYKVESEDKVREYLNDYRNLSDSFLNPFQDFSANTIVIWQGLYKFENDQAGTPSNFFKKELSETTKEYLQLIFHRFMEQPEPLQIRLNNDQLIPFNPFPPKAAPIETNQKNLLGNRLKLSGYILPNISISESKGISEWTLTHKSLMDMEGMYIYRANRIIVYGGWNGLIKKSPRLQLARLKVEIGNGIDHLFHLNVAKSSITIPFSERMAFNRYVVELKTQAEKEFYNHIIIDSPRKSNPKSFFTKKATSKGIALGIDNSFPLLESLRKSLDKQQLQQLNLVLRFLMTAINKLKQSHEDSNFSAVAELEEIDADTFLNTIETFLSKGISKADIMSVIIPGMGINIESLPTAITSKLK